MRSRSPSPSPPQEAVRVVALGIDGQGLEDKSQTLPRVTASRQGTRHKVRPTWTGGVAGASRGKEDFAVVGERPGTPWHGDSVEEPAAEPEVTLPRPASRSGAFPTRPLGQTRSAPALEERPRTSPAGASRRREKPAVEADYLLSGGAIADRPAPSQRTLALRGPHGPRGTKPQPRTGKPSDPPLIVTAA